MTPVDVIVGGLRIVATLLALLNICWAASGARALMSGRSNPPEIYLAVVFWFSIAVLVFQAAYFSGNTPSWRLLSYTILTASMGLAFVGHMLGATIKARQFYATYNHLSVVMAMVDLAEIDPAAAERQAAECRRLTVSKVIANG